MLYRIPVRVVQDTYLLRVSRFHVFDSSEIGLGNCYALVIGVIPSSHPGMTETTGH